jgi:alkylation response protein AidB-like acyl-CoA dehydrogenase
MIDLLPSPEQQQIADSIRGPLADRAAARERGKKISEDDDRWDELAGLGCFGLSISEDQGGVGLSVVEEIMAFREYGRFLVSPSIMSTVLGARIASIRGRDTLVADLIGGGRRAAIANPLPGAIVDRVCGGAFQVIDGRPKDLIVGWSEAGAGLFESEALGPIKEAVCIDPAVRLGRVDLTGVAPFLWVPAEEEPIWQFAMVLSAAILTGMIEAVRDLSVEYAKSREQFGHPIGMFQAIKHKCADMALWSEAAWSQTVWAALELRAGTADSAFQVINAKMIAAEAALDSARKAIQIYGGMGFTAEVDVHLFLKRAHLYNQLSGESRILQRKLLDLPLGV